MLKYLLLIGSEFSEFISEFSDFQKNNRKFANRSVLFPKQRCPSGCETIPEEDVVQHSISVLQLRVPDPASFFRLFRVSARVQVYRVDHRLYEKTEYRILSISKLSR